ncbi:hypothetical protein AWB70_07563 [Caballeronia cordobensis]|uniref:Uncharacterized protein n=1 Tax=Caballeronia cordobensis TaxID=1353886 RepID=A0A158JV49_CABCO|nr:hypothetical protein AWB70_07563 [Caballeronia cordobensis]
MHREEQHVFIGCETQQLHTQQRTVLKIEGAGGFGLREAADLLIIGKYNQRQRDPQFRSDALHSLPVVLRERCAQAFVTRHERIQGILEGRYIERSAQTHGDRNVIGGLSRIELLKEPQTFLCERQRQLRRTRHRLQGRQGAGFTRRFFQCFSE